MSNPNISSFEMLGVGSDASQAEITSSYRRLAKKYHPGMSNSDPVRAAKMRNLTTAYESLLTKEQRAAPLQSSGANTPGLIYEMPKADAENKRAQPKPADGQVRHAVKKQKGSIRDNYFLMLFMTVVLCAVVVVGYYTYLKITGSRQQAVVDAAASTTAAGENAVGTTVPLKGESLPDVAKADLLPAPAAIFSVPNQDKLRFGFAYAHDDSVYTKDSYKTIYTIDDADGKKTLSFSESSQTRYAPPTKGGPGFQTFQYQGGFGYLTFAVLNDGTVDGLLHWSDHGTDLVIHTLGMSATKFSSQNLFDMLGALQHPEPAPAAVPVAAAPPVSKPVAIVTESDSCNPGSVCYAQKHPAMRHHNLIVFRRR